MELINLNSKISTKLILFLHTLRSGWEVAVEAASRHFSVHKQLSTMYMVLSISSMHVWHGTIDSKLNFICLLIIMYVPNFKYILLEVCCWMVGRFYRKTILFKDECGSGLHDFYWGWLPHKYHGSSVSACILNMTGRHACGHSVFVAFSGTNTLKFAD